jgi:hypothetical protein
MDIRNIFGRGGNGSSGKGLVDVAPVCEGCSLLIPNPQDPPPDHDLPVAIAEVLQKWMTSQPVRVRHTLPIIRDGSMIGLFVWWDRQHP